MFFSANNLESSSTEKSASQSPRMQNYEYAEVHFIHINTNTSENAGTEEEWMA